MASSSSRFEIDNSDSTFFPRRSTDTPLQNAADYVIISDDDESADDESSALVPQLRQNNNEASGQKEDKGKAIYRGITMTDDDDDDSSDNVIVPHIGRPRPVNRTATPGPSTTVPLTDDHPIEDRLAELAHKLKDLESRTDMALLYPPHLCTPFNPPTPYVAERDVLNEFMALEDHITEPAQEKEFLEFQLQGFCVYRSPGHPLGFKGQYENLIAVASERDQRHWLLDGVLLHNGKERRIRAAQIINVSIGGLENLTEHTTAQSIWVKTREGGKKRYWYRLGRPTQAYAQHWSDFLWVADFCKYFIDYFFHRKNTGIDGRQPKITLGDFRHIFWNWLLSLHGDKLDDWYAKCNRRVDFRPYVLRFAQFLRNQSHSLDPIEAANLRLRHPIWNEIGVGYFSYDRQAASQKEKTVMTPLVASAFAKTFPLWQDHDIIAAVEMSQEVKDHRATRLRDWNFPDKFRYTRPRHHQGGISQAARLLEEAAQKSQPTRVSFNQLLGKVVVVRIAMPKKKGQIDYDFRYAWLALPRDTICGDESDETYYAIGNELFFSDRCNCKDVDLKDIFSVHDVSIFTDYAEEGSDFFIHMLYREVEQTFVHVKAGEDLPRCKCRGYPKKKYANATTKPPSADEPTQKKNDNHGPAKMLDNLSLFSGCGLLDHSFGAGSAGLIQTKLAVEHGEMALLSHKANDDDETKARCHYEVGSVNDVLRRFMTGKEPMKHFHCLTAGCPCQGYSQINAHKNTTKAYRNCSLLAHTISWIEVFMPAYAVIENVPNMDKMRPNACAQAICHLVALGYQVRKLLCSVSHLGGVSRRERLIILAAAPGVALPEAPPQTHSAAASLEFGGGSREIRTAGEAISDLTPVHNDATVNIADPDHLPLERLKVDFAENINYRSLVQQIPTRPKSMSLAKTYHAGGLLPDQRKWFETLAPLKQHPKKSRCLMRTDAGQPFRTVCTRISPMDAIFSGEILHPTQDRVVSMKESRRAMDVPDNFLLVGKLAEQYKMLGNAVPWSLGAALGRAVGRSWRAGVKGVEARKGLDPKPQKEEEEKVSLALAVSRVAVSSSPAAPKRHRESPSPAVDPDDSDSSSVVFLEERAVKKARPE